MLPITGEVKIKVYINGITVVEDEFRNIVFNKSARVDIKKVDEYGKTEDEIAKEIKYNYDHRLKELIYTNEYCDTVESLIGFEDLIIADVEVNDERVSEAREMLKSNSGIAGIVFLEGDSKYLVFEDIQYPSAYLLNDNGETHPYLSLIESNSYEDDARSIVDNDIRLVM